MKMNVCDYCSTFICHINVLLNENIKDCCEANLLELKSYYRLSNIFGTFNKTCNSCVYKELYSKVVHSVKDVLLKNKLELNNSDKKCDICKVLPHEIFAILDRPSKFDSSSEKLDSWYSELQYQEFLASLSESAFGECNNCNNGLDYYYNIGRLVHFLDDKNFDLLKQDLYTWKLLTSNDYIMSAASKVPNNNFKSVRKVDHFDKLTIYLDFNIFDKYEKDNDLKTMLDSTKEKGFYKFAFSSIHMEEICRMNDDEFETKRLESIHKLTDDLEILVCDDLLTFCTEDLKECFARAKKYSEMNNYAEEKNCIHSDEQSLFYNKYTSELFSKMINESSLLEMINNVSEDDKKKKLKDELPNEFELNEILHNACFIDYNIKDLQNIFSECITFTKLRIAINSISHLFNVLGYNSDKLTKKNGLLVQYPIFDKKFYRTIRSSFYDVEHLCYATKCSYFVTNDKKLYKRAKEIYNFIGCKTNAITFDELTQMLSI